jgi:hypothetical protein
MFGPLRVLGTLATEVIDALGMISAPIADEIRREQRARDAQVSIDEHLHEVNDHLGAIRALLEDVRNTQQHVADALTATAPRTASVNNYWADPLNLRGPRPTM